LAACSHGPPPVAPGTPIPAEESVQVDTYDKECAGLLAALDAYGTCVHLDDEDRDWIRATREYAERTFASGQKGLDLHPDADGARTMALKCHQAAASIGFMHQRCNAGPKPRAE
jgi:hypothetical protein